MNNIMQTLRNFSKEEDGAQVVEYALLIALVSIGLAILLATAFQSAPFSTLVSRVANCVTATTASC